MSEPAQNALEPDPVSTMTRTAGSTASRLRSASSSRVISSVTRLSGGLSRVTRATPSSWVDVTDWVGIDLARSLAANTGAASIMNPAAAV